MEKSKNTWKRIAAAVFAAVLCTGTAGSMPASALESNNVSNVQSQAGTLQTRDVWCADEDVNRWESEHFQFIWGKNGADSNKITEAFLQENAKHMEACWDVYMNELSMEPPTQSVNLALRDGNEYKVNFYISGTGLSPFTDDWAYMGYDSQGYAFMFCCVGAMQNSPNPSWVLPHEFGHVVTAHQRGWNENKYVQSWWESIANWYREQFLYSDYYSQWVTDPSSGTDYFETYMKNLCFTPILGRDNYASWAFLQYLTENPDNLNGYGADFMKTMMQQGTPDEYPYLEIDRLAGADIKDTLGHYAKRLATLDFKNQDRYQARQNELLARGEWNWNQIYTLPDEDISKTNCYTVPTDRAPQQFGINIIPLKADGGEISVTLGGLTDVQGADWRACIAVEGMDGSTRYSDLFKSGETAEIEYRDSDKAAYLVVTATPDKETWMQVGVPWAYGEGEFDENHYPFLNKTRYPYAVMINGASIQQRQSNAGMAQGSYHSNGGGFVASTAKVDASVYVGPNARVLGYATVTGNARIDGYATVTGSANVSGNAIVTGHAVVAERATVKDNAIIGDTAGVMGSSVVSDNGRVLESALVYDNYQVSGNATVKGTAFCMVNGAATGQAMPDGDYYDDSSRTVQAGSMYGWASPNAYVNSRPYNDGQVAGLEFDTDSSHIATDSFTSTYAAAFSPLTWEAERTSGKGVLTFEGEQYLTIDSSYAALHDAHYQTAVLIRNDSLIMPFYFGNKEKAMALAVWGGDLIFKFKDSSTDTEESLIAHDVCELGKWYTISVVLNGDEAKIVVNGEVVASGEFTADPVDVITEDAFYVIGGGNKNSSFSMDYFRVNYKEVAEPDYYYTATEDVIEPTEPSGYYGDMDHNNVIDVFDLGLLKRAVMNGETPADLRTDCDADGKTGVGDVVALQRYLLRLDNTGQTGQVMKS